MLTTYQLFRHALILSRWRRWLFPVLCILPYLGTFIWLHHRGQAWIAYLLLAPLLMSAILVSLTLFLAAHQFARVRQ
jgi:hypothetical protein